MGKMKSSKRSRKIGGGGGGKPIKKGGFQNKSGNKPTMKRTSDRKPRPGQPEAVAPMPEEKINNPFEIRTNKKKHSVLGNSSKHDRGMPGVSRAKALEKRKVTLLPEFLQRNKSNKFIDRRIGEKDSRLTEDDKAVRRVAMEKSKQYKRKSIFSLGDEDELLTHKGQAIASMTRYEDPRDLTDSEDEFLSDMFVSNANFGGFMKMKEKKDNVEEGEEDGKKTREQIIAELVLASKTRKMQKAKESDENFEKIQDLDNEFKSADFKSLMNHLQAPPKEKRKPIDDDLNEEQLLAMIRGGPKDVEKVKTKEEVKADPPQKPVSTVKEAMDYDRIVKELQFESKKARPSDIPKLDEQLREDERELFAQKVQSTDLEMDEKVKVMEMYGEVLEAKSGEKLKLPEALSGMLEFYIEQVDSAGQKRKLEGKEFSLFSDNYKVYEDLLIPELYSVMKMNAVGCTKRFLQHLIQAREDCFSKPSPAISTPLIILLQLCPRLFPLEDIRNVILGPALNTLSKCIYEGKCTTPKTLYRVLFCVGVFYEVVETTKRFSPEVVHFLWSLLLCYCPESVSVINSMVPNVRKTRQFLTPSSEKGTNFTDLQDIVLTCTLELLGKFVRMYEYLPSSVEMFSPWKETLATISALPSLLQSANSKIIALSNIISGLQAGKQFLRIAAAKPKPLKLYEPQIDEDFDVHRKKKLPRKLQEQSRLSHKIKQEMKSAVREIKKDNAFLARQQLKDQLAGDAERKRKVKDLLGSLANQEGDYQKLKRTKK